ncbi:MAG: zinc-dependent alcohol dehydrogenase family protein [Paracoccaceae bacterium]
MRAALMTRYRGPLDVEEVPEPACPSDGVVIAVHACGVCRSDHHAWAGVDPDVTLPHVLGHECAGVVVEAGPECRGFRPGDRVTAPFILACGHCRNCRSGQPTACDAQAVIGFTIPGAFAERLALPTADRNLVHLPDAVDFVHAAAMGCRVTTAWRGLVDRAALRPGEWVAVHGAGGVGLSAVMIARALGARVVAIDISADALDRARMLGAEAVIDARGDCDVGSAVRDATDGGAHVSIEALGRAETFANSLKSLRKLGRHIQIGMPTGSHATVDLPLLDLVYARQLSLVGMRGLGAAGFAPLLGLVEAGQLNLGALIGRRIGLDEAGAALAAMDGTAQPAGVTVIDRF